MLEIGSGPPPLEQIEANLRYWFAQHPTISHFRWDHNIWGSSIVFLAHSIFIYLFLVLFLNLVMKLRIKPLPLDRISAIYNSLMLVMSVIVLVGCLEATVEEIKEMKWLRRKNSGVELMVCFPLGTRSAGRVFFWSYVFYLTKYYELLDTFIMILGKKSVKFPQILSTTVPIFVCFFWLEFSQSLQILCILTNTVMNVILCSDFFIRGNRGLNCSPRRTNLAAYCRMVELGVAYSGSIWVVWLHMRKQGCNGMVGCLLNAFCSAILFLLFIRFQKQGQTKNQSRSA
ncbi:hypothetical protein SUGI_1178100 [Cryptomeria japonica]|nr:hypothetical protein SUGI_1178100 [Cryptomeria japonica]